MATLIARFTNRLEDTGDIRRKCISAARLPTDDERATLLARRAELHDALAPDADRARRILLALLASFPSYGEDEATGRFILQACCRACASVPAWSLEEASARFIENRVRIPWDMAKRPTPPQILAEAKICTLAVEEELFRLSQVLDAEVVDLYTTQAERDDAVARWEELKAGIRRSNVVGQNGQSVIDRARDGMREANARFEGRGYTPIRVGAAPDPSA